MTKHEDGGRPTPEHTEEFKRLLENAGCTREGAEWAVLAHDPMHDYVTEVRGMPMGDGRSIVYDVRSEITVTKSANLAAGLWDAHVAFIPMVRYGTYWTTEAHHAALSVNFASTSMNKNRVREFAPNANTYLPPGLVTVWQNNNGVGSYDFRSAANTDITTIDFEDYFAPEGYTRVVAGGLEVINTTPEVYAGGSATAYRFRNEPVEETQKIINAGDTASEVHQTLALNAPPSTVAQAKLMGGLTWHAKEGCYLPLVQHATHNFPTTAVNRVGVLRSEVPSTTYAADGNAWFVPRSAAIQTGSVNNGFTPALALPWDSSGVMFTGLSDETSLTITARFLIEHFPSPSDSMMALAKPSPRYDSRAIELYEESLSVLHPGYPAGWNASGDLFGSVLSHLKSYLGVVQRPLNLASRYVPLLSPVAHGVDAVAAGVDAVSRMRRRRPKQSNKKKKAGNVAEGARRLR